MDVIWTTHLLGNISLSIIIGLIASLLRSWQDSLRRQNNRGVSILGFLLTVFVHSWSQRIVPLNHIDLKSDGHILSCISLLLSLDRL